MAVGVSDWLTIAQAAELMQVHTNTIENWLKRGLPHARQGKIVRINRSELESWLRQNP